ncbi:unnamed protein product [Effrenium voratum]|nr:unnamed protein product [Effrenium voratum]
MQTCLKLRLSVWPGLGDAAGILRISHVTAQLRVPQKARGQLTSDEKLAYSDLKFVEHLGSGEFGQVFRGFYKKQEVAIKQLYWDNTVLPQAGTMLSILEAGHATHARMEHKRTKDAVFGRHLRHKRLVNFVGACLEIPNLLRA